MRSISAVVLKVFLSFLFVVQPALAIDPARYIGIHTDNPLRDRVTYLFTLIESEPAATHAVEADPDLHRIYVHARQSLATAAHVCSDMACIAKTMMLSEADITVAGMALKRLGRERLADLVESDLRPSGLFSQYADMDDGDFLAAAWLDTANAVNRLYRVYGLGDAPRYPEIDAMAYDPKGNVLLEAVKASMRGADAQSEHCELFYLPWSQIGLKLLSINRRDEAARFEPLLQGQNAASSEYARSIDWSKFPYTAIVVPGAGLAEGESGLSATGAVRVRLAVDRFRKGMAPFLLVSGGYVHPNRTPFNEAVEMKKALMRIYSVPEHAIIIEPYARHTTTNLRNAARLLYIIGAPFDRPYLVTTTDRQSQYIESEEFNTRFLAELGYVPYRFLERLNAHDVVLMPLRNAMRFNPEDPLDP